MMVICMAYEAILFDLDGTLVDSNQLILETFRQTVGRHFPQKAKPTQQMVDYIGPPLKESFRDFTDDSVMIDTMIDTYRKVYQTIEFDYVRLFPNVIETLQTLQASHIPVAVVTTKFRESAWPSMHRFGIDKLTDVLIALDDVTHHKPHPQPIQKALKVLKKRNAVMIGDNLSDIRAGKRAHIATAAVSWSIHKDKLKQEKPDHWIKDMTDVIKLIK